MENDETFIRIKKQLTNIRTKQKMKKILERIFNRMVGEIKSEFPKIPEVNTDDYEKSKSNFIEKIKKYT